MSLQWVPTAVSLRTACECWKEEVGDGDRRGDEGESVRRDGGEMRVSVRGCGVLTKYFSDVAELLWEEEEEEEEATTLLSTHHETIEKAACSESETLPCINNGTDPARPMGTPCNV